MFNLFFVVNEGIISLNIGISYNFLFKLWPHNNTSILAESDITVIFQPTNIIMLIL